MHVQIAVGSTAEAYRILRHSCRQERKRAPTGLNDWSSRSHSIVTVAVYMPQVDLPGSAPADAQNAPASFSGEVSTSFHINRNFMIGTLSLMVLHADGVKLTDISLSASSY